MLPETATKYCTEWCTLQTLWLMRRFLDLGLRLELFLSDEAAQVYWYWQFLFNWSAHIVAKLAFMRQQLEQQLLAEASATAEAEATKAVVAAAEAGGSGTKAAGSTSSSTSGGGGGGGGGGKGKKGKKGKKGSGGASGAGSSVAAATAAAAAAAAERAERRNVERELPLQVQLCLCKGMQNVSVHVSRSLLVWCLLFYCASALLLRSPDCPTRRPVLRWFAFRSSCVR